MSMLNNFVGQQFGRLNAVEKLPKYKGSKIYYKCKCDCGKIKIIYEHDLINGKTKSCGCYKNECTLKRTTTHNSSKTLLYYVYMEMIKRCYKPTHRNYKDYGAKGVGVDEIIWRDGKGFLDYKEWAYANGYKEERLPNGKNKWTIDRIDNSKGYSKENCRWITQEEQLNNRSNSHYITYNGETKTLAQWAKIYKINKDALRCRIVRYKWSLEKALTTPVKIYKKGNK